MPEHHEFDHVDAFTTDAIGPPGQRTFFIQARATGQQVTVRCEKQQVAALAQYLRGLLKDLPPAADLPVAAAMDLADPGEPAFVLGSIGLGYDRDADRFVVQLEELVPGEDEDDDEGPAEPIDRGRLRALLSRGQVEAFCEQADLVVAAGRPTCLFCGGPMDPDGHACPRMN
jgi:uncharacterized repeat protein (TIGR03847 family)